METSDSKNIEAVLKGERSAFRSLVDRHGSKVYAVCLSLLHNAQDAEDLTQDTFVAAFRSLDKFDQQRPFLPWVTRIAANLSINFLKRRRQTVPLEESLADDPAADDPAEAAEEQDLVRHVYEALGQLSEQQQTIFLLYHRESLPYADIAKQLALPLGTVKTQLHRARAKVRELVSEHRRPR